jgi:casein kinase II subunit beta
MGPSDIPNLRPVKLYCARCEDLYNPKSSRHAAIDGAYFGTSFHDILFQVYPALIPTKSAERYVPRVYGFKVHAAAALARWQNGKKEDMRRRLRKMDVESGFREEGEDGEGAGVEEDEVDDLDGEEDLALEYEAGAGAGVGTTAVAGAGADMDGVEKGYYDGNAEVNAAA